jgi:hypothetical protein
MKHDPMGRSFDELRATFRLLEIQKSGEQKPEDLEEISLLQREIKFEKLKRARQEYMVSGKDVSEWPKALQQGGNNFEWEICARKALNLEIPMHLKVVCKEFLERLEKD